MSPVVLAVVLLVPDVGFAPAIWETGMAQSLRAVGFATELVDGPAALGPEVLDRVRRDHPGVPVYGVGHGFGGTALYRHQVEHGGLSGIVGLSAPLTDFGRTRAAQRLLDRASEGPVSWIHQTEEVRDVLLGPSGITALRPGLVGPFRAAEANVSFDPRRLSPAIPILAVLGHADGFAPPWQCDPIGVGLVHGGVERLYLGRLHGQQIDYNHLDLLMFADAPSDVFAPVIRWLTTGVRTGYPRVSTSWSRGWRRPCRRSRSAGSWRWRRPARACRVAPPRAGPWRPFDSASAVA